MGGTGSKLHKETVTEFCPGLDGWISCPGIGNGNFFPGQTILCKTNGCSASGQILLDTQDATLRFQGGLKQWPIQRRQVKMADNSPQKLAFTFAKGDDINLWLSAYANLQIAAGKKRTKEYKMLFEQTRKLSVDIEHFRSVFEDMTLKQGAEGIKGETSFFVVTDVFAVGKVRCESSERVDGYLQTNVNNQKGSGVAVQARRTYSAKASQFSETPIALYMKCAEVKYDPQTWKITEIESCDASKFRKHYTLMDEKSLYPRYQCVNTGDITIAYKVVIDSGTKTSADVFLQLVDQDDNWSDQVLFSNPWWRRRFTADGVYSSVIRVSYKNTGGPQNNGQSAGDLVSKVKVWHDNSGFSPGWFLNKVVLQNLKTGLLQEFPFYRWLSRWGDDYRIAREVTMMGPGDGQVRLYKVRVTTADKWNAASKRPVMVCIHGSLGQSERVQVLGELKRGRETEYTIVAHDLGDLQSVELSLRNKGHWFLEKVKVKIPGSSQLPTAQCDTWVNANSNMFNFAGAAMK
ncbi:uncharacterized protein [Branchiostoma lanceolatum]|uniref:uncharacterized protein n=1 Tax=Branchiostoma lanceolatum TaxID=7740 RepID=UPI00345680B6